MHKVFNIQMDKLSLKLWPRSNKRYLEPGRLCAAECRKRVGRSAAAALSEMTESRGEKV